MDAEIISAARLNLTMEKYPYLSYIIYNLTPVEKPGLGTMAVDKWWRLYYDPALDWDVPTTAGVLYHEAGHVMRDHAGRGVGYNHQLFNIAGDAEINDDVRDEGLALPEWVVYPEGFGCEPHQMAEFYYEYLIENAKECDGSCQDGDGEGGHFHIPGLEGKGPHNGKDCGSIADGNKRDYEKDGDGNGRKVSEAEAEVIRQQVAEKIIEEAQKSRGNVPAWMERWADNFLNPKVDWRKEFRAELSKTISHVAGNMDFTYRRPSRRSHAVPNVILPSMISPEINAAIVIDTSGSMSQGNLEECLGECKGIIESAGSKVGVAVYAVDADVTSAKRVFNTKDIVLTGGGGTDMRVGIDAAMEGKPRPDFIVVLTDGYTPWPEESPGPKVIIGIVSGGHAEGAPEWAKVLYLNDDERAEAA